MLWKRVNSHKHLEDKAEMVIDKFKVQTCQLPFLLYPTVFNRGYLHSICLMRPYVLVRLSYRMS